MTRFFTAFAAVATLIAAPAFANDPAKKDDKDAMAKRVCVVDKDQTGSRIAKKVCKSRGDWIAQTGIDPLKK